MIPLAAIFCKVVEDVIYVIVFGSVSMGQKISMVSDIHQTAKGPRGGPVPLKERRYVFKQQKRARLVKAFDLQTKTYLLVVRPSPIQMSSAIDEPSPV